MPKSAEYLDQHFDEAIAFFREKLNLPTKAWTDIRQGMHSRAFVVAGAMKAELLADLRESVDKAISRGTTIDEFRKGFDAIVAKYGWKYKGGRGWRTAVIFNTNLATAYDAGHWVRMTDPDMLRIRPYLRYVPSHSDNKREEHMQWYNLILPHDHPFWKTHAPRNGWGCKCGLVSMSGREVERLKEEEEDGDYPVKTDVPEIDYYEWKNKATGKVVKVPKGIDPGWDYNPGETAWGRNQALRLMEDRGPWIDIDPWDPEKYGRPLKIGDAVEAARAGLGTPVRPGDAAALRAALRNAVGGDEAVFTDPTGGTVMVTQAIADHIIEDEKRWDGREAYFPLIPELIEDPYEIWVSFARSTVSGRIGIRRKYVKAVRVSKNKILGLYAEFMNGHWVTQDMFRGGLTGAGRLRRGRMVYGK